jgi:hypothetical protein
MSHLTNEAAEAAAVACTLGSATLGTQVERWKVLCAEAGTDGISVIHSWLLGPRAFPAS